uniref:CCDC113/CCDC96 coiled-coil domain-containing protein n=1 Tax=Lygus hesperus TaxID=30085 RepID=A0A0A9YLG6_LYGHE
MASLKRTQSTARLEKTTAAITNDVNLESGEGKQKSTSKVRITTPTISTDVDKSAINIEERKGDEKSTSKLVMTTPSASNLKRTKSITKVSKTTAAILNDEDIESGEGENKSTSKDEITTASTSRLKRTQSTSKVRVTTPALSDDVSKSTTNMGSGGGKKSSSKVGLTSASAPNLKRTQSTSKIGMTTAAMTKLKRSQSTLKVKGTTTDTPDNVDKTLDEDSFSEPSSENVMEGSYPVSQIGEYVEEENQPESIQRDLGDQRKIKSKLFTLSEITWKEPDSLTRFSSEYGDFEEMDAILAGSRIFQKMRAESATERIYLRDDSREAFNESHGYTLVEEEDGFGKKVTRKFYPRIRQHIKSYKKLLPMKITYNKLSVDETGVVEEEDVVDEEMDVDEITNTILIKTKDENGQDVFVEKDIMTTNVHDPSKRKKYLKLRMVNDEGQIVEELVELTDDNKRTNDIIKAAAPYIIKKKLKEKSVVSGFTQLEEQAREKTVSRIPSLAYADWVKDQNSQKTKLLHKAILNLKKAVDDQKMLKRLNKYLGKKLCQYYDLRGIKDPDFKYTEKVGNNEERKASYHNKLFEFEDVVNFLFSESKLRDKWITLSNENLQKDVDELNELRQKFYELEEAMVKDENPTADSLCHRSMTHQELMNQQKLMDANLSKVRLEYIKSNLILNELKDKEAAFHTSINQLEQVDFINYESMREKTKDLNDKLDLKEKQVMAMKDTITQRVQALAHVRLKTEHMSQENDKLREEKQLIVHELKALRMENIKVQQERRKLESQLRKILEKEGLEKYPYLMKEAPTLGVKDEEQMQLLSDMVAKCSEMQEIVQNKLEKHKEKVERYQKIKEQRRQKNRLFSFEFK